MSSLSPVSGSKAIQKKVASTEVRKTKAIGSRNDGKRMMLRKGQSDQRIGTRALKASIKNIDTRRSRAKTLKEDREIARDAARHHVEDEFYDKQLDAEILDSIDDQDELLL